MISTIITCMRSHVNNQLARLYKRFSAHRTFVRPFTGVNAHVTMQFATVFECTTTHFTFVWTLFCVDSSMNL